MDTKRTGIPGESRYPFMFTTTVIDWLTISRKLEIVTIA